jgi:choline dehydrogenase-like flavoprotein
VEQVNDVLSDKPLISVATAGFNPGNYRGELMTEHWAEQADVIVVGGGLSGLVAATEIADAGKRVIVVDQEGEQSLGGQAFWSFGGLFLVNSPEQRRLGIKDFLAAPMGRGLCGVRCGREARLAARDGSSHLPRGRLGRARRL